MKIGTWLLLSLSAVLYAVAPARAAEDAKTELEGTWNLQSVQRNGRALRPPADTRMIVTENKFVIKNGDTVGVAGTIKVDPAKKPKTIDMTYTEGPDKDQTIKGVYELDGDTLRFCRAGTPDGERPTDLKSKTGSGELSSVYKRAK